MMISSDDDDQMISVTGVDFCTWSFAHRGVLHTFAHAVLHTGYNTTQHEEKHRLLHNIRAWVLKTIT